MSDLNEDPYAEAKLKGLVVVIPEANELFIDIDDEESYKRFQAMLEVLEQRYFLDVAHDGPSASGAPGHRHIYIDVFGKDDEPVELTPHQRIAMQAVLGSDPHREALSLLRLLDDKRPPTIFFELPSHPRGAKKTESA